MWGCDRKLEGLNRLQFRALRIFFGVGIRHPKGSLLLEAGAFPVDWLARMRCVGFWFKALASPLYEGRIVRVAALEALECGGSWMVKLRGCLKSLGWSGVGVDEMRRLSGGEIKSMIESCARRRIEEGLTEELRAKPKLAVLHLLMERGVESRCLYVANKGFRRVMMMLRGGTAPLMIESGRWRGLRREERVCRECQIGEVEDVAHWLLKCDAWVLERRPLLEAARRVCSDFEKLCDEDRLVFVLDKGCMHVSMLKAIMNMWYARF